MSNLSGHSWRLDRYARFLSKQSESNKEGQWKHYDFSNDPSVMTLTESKQLIISHDMTLLESHNLANAWQWMRGLSCNDSLLFVYKYKTETRKFRVRFCKEDVKSGSEVCIHVSQQLSGFFPLKRIDKGSRAEDETRLDDENQGVMQTQCLTPDQKGKSSQGTQLHGEVTLNSMAQAILRNQPLPLAYQQHQDKPEMIPLLVRMCLGDPAFPAFVEAVEAAIKAISDSSL